MDVKLVIEQGSDATKAFRLRSAETIIGRQNDCDLRIPSGAVSRRHCRLSFRDDILTVEDLDSANGTNVNGERIEGPRVLRPGDRFDVGPVTFLVKYQLTPAAIDRLLREEELHDSSDVDVEPVEGVPEIEVEELTATDDTDEAAGEEKPRPAKGKQTTKTPTKPVAKSPPKKPAKTQQFKKKPVDKKKPAAARDDNTLDPDVAAMLDGEKSWHMPSNDDFRDFLTQMEDE